MIRSKPPGALIGPSSRGFAARGRVWRRAAGVPVSGWSPAVLAGLMWPGGHGADRCGSPALPAVGLLAFAAGLAVGAGRQTGLIAALVMLGAGTGAFSPAGDMAITAGTARDSAGMGDAVLGMTRGLRDAIAVIVSMLAVAASRGARLLARSPAQTNRGLPATALALTTAALVAMVVCGSRRPGACLSPALAGAEAAVGSPRVWWSAADRPPVPLLAPVPTAVLVPTPVLVSSASSSSWASTGAHAVSRSSAWMTGAVAGTRVPAREGMDPMNMTIDQPRDDRDWRRWALSQLRAAMTQAGRRRLLHVLPWPDARLDLDLIIMDTTGGPTGSLKDWYVVDLLFDAILHRRLRRGMLVVDATSGSTGIAEAYWARRLGLRFIAVMPASTTPAKQELIRQHGGECHLVTGPDTITEVAQRLCASESWYYLGQFPNAALTPDYHGDNSLPRIAAREMLRLRHPVPTWIVVPAGTGRTLTGFGRWAGVNLSEGADDLTGQICVADAATSALCRGWPTRDRRATGAASLIEGIARPQVEFGMDYGLMDDVVGVGDADAIAMLRFLERERLTEKRFGGSTGVVVYGAALKLAQMRNRGEPGAVLAVLGDDGLRYDDSLYHDEFLAQRGLDLDDANQRLRHLIADLTPAI